jgi:acetyltransferase-like isoleucine patch superfamily enzyme
VTFGLGAMLDIFYPELISIGEGTLVGYNTVILGHEYLQDEYRTGEVKIGSRVMIGANCTVLPGVRIGDGASISAMTLVNCDIPAGQAWGGVPAKKIK